MRLLRIIGSASPRSGGPAEGMLRVGEALAALGHIQDFATLDAPDAPFLADMPARVVALGTPPEARRGLAGLLPERYGWSPRMVPWLRAHLRDYDAAIVSGVWNYAAAAARRTLPGGPVPYIVFTHGMLDPWFRTAYPRKDLAKRLLWPLNEGVLLNRADLVLFTSEDERLRAHRSFRPWRVRERVVRYGTAVAPGDPVAQRAVFRAALPRLAGRRFLLFLGRIHPKKGCDLLVEAFGAIAADADLDLVIAGPDQIGAVAALRARAAALGIAARVHFPGMLVGDAKWGAFHACEAFILPSHQENFGIAIAEAAACGAPSLITDKVNIWREFDEAGAALVAPDDQVGITDLLRRFLALDAPARARMGSAARRLFAERFEVASAARDLAATLEEIVAARRSAA